MLCLSFIWFFRCACYTRFLIHSRKIKMAGIEDWQYYHDKDNTTLSRHFDYLHCQSKSHPWNLDVRVWKLGKISSFVKRTEYVILFFFLWSCMVIKGEVLDSTMVKRGVKESRKTEYEHEQAWQRKRNSKKSIMEAKAIIIKINQFKNIKNEL